MNVILKLTRNACLVSAVMLLVGQASLCFAQQKVLIDFGSSTSYRGISVPNPDPKGHYWNSNQPGQLMDLVDVTNTATGMQLGWITAVGTDSYNGPAGPTDPPPYQDYLPLTDIDAAALGDLGVKEAAFDYYTGATMQIQSLDPSKKYTVTFFGSPRMVQV